MPRPDTAFVPPASAVVIFYAVICLMFFVAAMRVRHLEPDAARPRGVRHAA